MAHPAAIFLDHLLDQVGDKVKYGTEVAADATDSKTWDSSELVEWAAHQAGVTIGDGSWKQYKELQSQGLTMETETALQTPGALLFKFSSDPLTGIPNERQVMISLGNGQVIDASGKQIAISPAEASDFTHAALVPEFATNRTDDVDVRAFVDQRLEHMDPVDVVTTPAPASTPTPPVAPPVPKPEADPTTTTQEVIGNAIDLRKQAHDLHQQADELYGQAKRGEERKGKMEADADKARLDAQAKMTEADHEFVEYRMAKLEASQLKGPAAEVAQKEAHEHFVKSNALKDEAAELKGNAEQLDANAARAGDAIAITKEQADAIQNESAEIWTKSNAAIEAEMPKMALGGPSLLNEVKVLELPPAPPAGSDEATIRKWVQQREAAEASMQAAGQQKLKDATQLDDLAEVKRDLALDADARAAAALANIASEETRISSLRERVTTAEDQQSRLAKEYQEEQAQYEQLSKAGDTEGARLSSERANDLLMQESSWTSQVNSLNDRVKVAEMTITGEQENAREYRDIAANLREEAQRAAVRSDEQEAAGNALMKQADSVDEVSDPVTDALGLGVATTVIVTGTEDLTVEVPGRDLTTLTPDERKSLEEALPGADTPDQSDITAPVVAPDAEPVPTAAVDDTSFEDTLATIDSSTDSLMLDDQPAEPDPSTTGDTDFTA